MKGFWEFELSIRARLQRNPLLYYVLDVVLKFFFHVYFTRVILNYRCLEAL